MLDKQQTCLEHDWNNYKDYSRKFDREEDCIQIHL